MLINSNLVFQINKMNIRLSFIFILIFIFLFNTTSLNPNYEIYNLTTHTGLYFNRIGDAQISNKEITFFTRINITDIKINFDQLMKTFHKTQYLCNQLTTLITNEYNNEINCKIDLDLLTTKLNKLKYKLDTIYYITGIDSKTERKKEVS